MKFVALDDAEEDGSNELSQTKITADALTTTVVASWVRWKPRGTRAQTRVQTPPLARTFQKLYTFF